MKIPFQSPDPAGSERAQAAMNLRQMASEVARLRPQALTRANGEENDHAPDENGARAYPANFTKGLAHDVNGVLAHADDYHRFVEAINSSDRTLFERSVISARSRGITFGCSVDGSTPGWRGWESPRAGHVYELEGPDAGAVGMAPAPRVGSSELAAEMAEVYALALLRDVPFTEIANGGGQKLCDGGGTSELSAAEIVAVLNGMPFFSVVSPASATPNQVDASGLNRFERNRRAARTGNDITAPVTLQNVFRGSTVGAVQGPYISQFLLAGSNAIAGTTGGTPGFPSDKAKFDSEDGFIAYGSQIIDQRCSVHAACLDYMTTWQGWIDVQNGQNLKGADRFDDRRRFITTPRDLATYVHFDALYQAYLNAALLLLGSGAPTSRGFPEPSPTGHRDAFATFGGPHVLSLVTEVATRCLKAVRRQKFNYHRRARPEVMGGRFTLVRGGIADKLGKAAGAFQSSYDELPEDLRLAVVAHNAAQNALSPGSNGDVTCPQSSFPGNLNAAQFAAANLLLPMAFPEGSPMHPAYGAGHATVAGGCVTMLKAFFEMFDTGGVNGRRVLKLGDKDYFEPNANGTKLVNKNGIQLTIQGELDKLAANIAIGRNMAGVHYYSDYYDSLRMGERIAIGILLEQAPTYGEEMEVSFESFDGDLINISGEAGSCPSLSVFDRDGDAVLPEHWWLRHVSGAEIIIDH